MDALSFNLCFDITSLAHCDAIWGERHPPHLGTLLRNTLLGSECIVLNCWVNA